MAAVSSLSWRRIRKGALAVLAALVGAALMGFVYLRSELPRIRTLADYVPLQASRVYSDDGHLVGQFFTERRTVVPFAAIPRHVVQAFLAAEDANFYEHEGIDYFGILRAAIKNLRPGAHLQGASTITQQTVKTLVLGPERSLVRKAREVILARQLEQVLSKDEILAIYLNQIYFGNGAWGVEEAAQTYFGKSVRQLSLAEGAYLAGIPKNPGRYNIKNDPLAAKARQRYVLEQMAARAWAEAAAVATAITDKPPHPAPPPPYVGRAPHYVEHVRKLLVETYGESRVYQGGLVAYTGMHAQAQAAAVTALRQGVEDLARKQGYSGAPVRIEVDRLSHLLRALHSELDAVLQRRAIYANPPQAPNGLAWDLSALTGAATTDEAAARRTVELIPLYEYSRLRAPVVRLDRIRHEAIVDLGPMEGRLPLRNMAWARRYAPRGGSTAPRDPSDALAVGDVVTVEVARGGLQTRRHWVELVLVPEPQLEGALLALDPHSRHVWAMVGGYHGDAGGFNRATQAMRQPGSAFKPIVYAAALANGIITPASICPDSPVVILDPWTGKAWKPENYEDGRYDGNMTYRTALMRSKNTCSVRLLQKLTPQRAIETARVLGISARLPENLTLALGTGDVTPLELCNAFATIASGGLRGTPIFLRKVSDAAGNVLSDNRVELTEALSPQVAFVLTSMMRSVVERGTARSALMLERPLAGKTGTSQESRNVWFSGFSPELSATVWMGFDNNDPVGYETGASAALPTWIRFMGAALAGEPVRDFPAAEGIVTVPINPDTGSSDPGPQGVPEVFVPGTEPHIDTQALPSIFTVE